MWSKSIICGLSSFKVKDFKSQILIPFNSFVCLFKHTIIYFEYVDFGPKNVFTFVQLNQYETAPNFIQLNQNLAWDCLFI